MWASELRVCDYGGDGGGLLALGRSSFFYIAEFDNLRTLYVEHDPSEEKCTQMLEFIRTNPTPPVQYFEQYHMTGVHCPAMAAIFEHINPTLEFSGQDFLYVTTNPAVPIKSLASASIAVSVYRMRYRKWGHVEVLIAALPSFKAKEIRFNDCNFSGYGKPLFRALAMSSAQRVLCAYDVELDGGREQLVRQFQVRVAMFALLHARRRGGDALRKLPVEMYRLVGQML